MADSRFSRHRNLYLEPDVDDAVTELIDGTAGRSGALRDLIELGLNVAKLANMTPRQLTHRAAQIRAERAARSS